jgi:YD repeat-containing protein
VSENGISFGYDADGLLTAAGVLQLQRNASNGLLTGTSLGAVSDSYTHNQSAEITGYTAKYTGAQLLSFDYTRDALGRIATIGAQGFEYDDDGRLVRVTSSGTPVAEYDYDVNSNRTAHRYLGGSVTANYDDQDRLLTYGDTTYEYTTYEYTANGDLKTTTLAGTTMTFDYDAFGNLRGVQITGLGIDYVIDGQNRRIGKEVNGVLVQGWLYADPVSPAGDMSDHPTRPNPTAARDSRRIVHQARRRCHDIFTASGS